MQHHLYLTDAAIMQIETTVIAVRKVAGGHAVAVQDNLHRPTGGGEPADRGTLILDDGAALAVNRVEKAEGYTLLVVQRQDHAILSGMPAQPRLDVNYRNGKRQLHTLIHATLAVAVRRLEGLRVDIADVSIDATEALIVASWSGPVTAGHFGEIDSEIRSIVLQSRPVMIDRAKSLDHGRQPRLP